MDRSVTCSSKWLGVFGYRTATHKFITAYIAETANALQMLDAANKHERHSAGCLLARRK